MKNFFTHLVCSVCGERHTPSEIHTVCRSCGKTLLAQYDLSAARSALSRSRGERTQDGFWKYRPLLPVQQDDSVVSLGELITPLISIDSIAASFQLGHFFIKDEGHLPTGSFKARGLALAVSRGKELGVEEFCIPTAGNAGGALAAYAARAGLRTHVFMPSDTPMINVKECQAYGAEITFVDGTISDAAKAMTEQKKRHPEWFDVSTLKEPYRLEGKKTMGYELGEQCEYRLPEVILYPTGGGTGLIGMWKAFREMEMLGWIDSRRPRMVSVQATGCAPIVRAYEQGLKTSEFWEGAATVASGLRVPKAFADYLILEAVYESKGCAIAVTDKELIQTVHDIAAQSGLFMCPEGAATVAALPALVKKGIIRKGDVVVAFNTAAGLKYPEVIGDPS